MKLTKLGKWTSGIILASGILTVGAIQTINWIDGNVNAYEEKEKAHAEALADHQDAIKVTDEHYEGTDELTQSLIDSNETTGINDLEGAELVDRWVDGQWWNEIDVQDTIHKMSHQKVIASMKRGSIEITKTRLENLSKAIEQNRDHLDNYGVYRAIVDKWIKGDFKKADQDHNAIWEMQDGEIGQATGVASKEEEKEYIENTFGDGQ